MKTLLKITLLAIFLLSANAVFAQETAEQETLTEFEKGVALYDGGDYRQASKVLGTLVKTDKENRPAYIYLGMSLAKLDKNSDAFYFLRRADLMTDDTPAGEKPQITRKPRAEYTAEARANQTQGTVKLALELGADGEIKTIVPFQAVPDGLTESAIEAAKRIVFKPAVKDGREVSSIFIVHYDFKTY